MAISSFLNINGLDLPSPKYGFTYTISTVVNSGRNTDGAVIGQRVGRDLYKLDNLSWVGLPVEKRREILRALEPFYVNVTFEDYRTGGPITITMYPSDRKGKPLFASQSTHLVTDDETFSFNLIDCGL